MGRIFQTDPAWLHARPAWLQYRPRLQYGYNIGPKQKLKFRSEPGQAQKGNCNFGPSPARPETKYKILARDRPGPEIFFFRFRPRQLGLSDFKTGPFSTLHIINVFFVDDLFFRKLLKQPISIDCFQLNIRIQSVL